MPEGPTIRAAYRVNIPIFAPASITISFFPGWRKSYSPEKNVAYGIKKEFRGTVKAIFSYRKIKSLP
jgi:hypothetical protein